MAQELGDQVLVCLCFVKLFSSGPLHREETDITNHMKPVYCLPEAVVLDFLGIGMQVNEQTLSNFLSQSALGVQFMCVTVMKSVGPTWKCWYRSTHSQNGSLCRVGVNA